MADNSSSHAKEQATQTTTSAASGRTASLRPPKITSVSSSGTELSVDPPETSLTETSAAETSAAETPTFSAAPSEPLPAVSCTEPEPPSGIIVNTATENRPDHPYLGYSDEKKPYYVKVNVLRNTITVYGKDENGFHTVPLRAMVCSTGSDTPQSGIYSLSYQGQWPWLRLFGNVNGRYCTQITGNILFHSVPYLTYGDKGSLEYWEFDKLGTSASMGCVRLILSDAIWIYNNMRQIAGVEFYSDPVPGPLGKPVAPKISENEACRNWDPSDTDPESPWNNLPEESSSSSASETSATKSDTASGVPTAASTKSDTASGDSTTASAPEPDADFSAESGSGTQSAASSAPAEPDTSNGT
ncbi:MAG: L,D-transpeptidase [Clostridiales bacterium]|nr:L,D-transpeptidase [Clostridiales bacterium]